MINSKTPFQHVASLPSLNYPLPTTLTRPPALPPTRFRLKNRKHLFSWILRFTYGSIPPRPRSSTHLQPTHKPNLPFTPSIPSYSYIHSSPFQNFGFYPLLHPIISPSIALHNLAYFTTLMSSLLRNHCRLNGKQHKSLMLGNG